MHTASNEPALRPPSRLLLALEGVRAMWEFGASLATLPVLHSAPRGDGHSVLIFPGLVASDLSTQPLRRYLEAQGYRAHEWGLGRNFGPRPGVLAACRRRIEELRRESGRKVSLIGWSLGGVFARDLALTMPEAVRSVVTLGSPFARELQANNMRRLYEEVTGEKVDASPEDLAALAGELPSPATSIYTRTDGVVNWRCSLGPESARSENIEILLASHIGLGGNPATLWAIADRLAQKEGEFKLFRRAGPFAFAYGRLTAEVKP
jgi:pimeloyl-ACP methyl ester carboxylesterase